MAPGVFCVVGREEKSMTVDEAREELRAAETDYLAIEVRTQQEAVGVPTAERVIRQTELAGALFDAAQRVIKARTVFESVVDDAGERRRQQAEIALVDVEAQLGDAIAKAEADMATLKESVGRVLELSRQRYSLKHDITGRATVSILGRGAVAGWIQHHLGGGLDLVDLGVAAHHYRAPLQDTLGLTSRLNMEVDNETEN